MSASAAIARFLEELDRLDDPTIFTSIASEDRLESLARVIDGRPAGESPLRGKVFAVKDNIDVVGLATTAACPSFAREPAASAPVVQQLVRAGAVPVAKTNMDQFATGLVGTRSPYGTPVNPLDAALVPGGSSSGSAVAVARRLVDFALGTDTAGSGRVPAAMCGIVGLKPAPGRVSCRGVVPAVRSIDTVSIFAHDVWLADEVLRLCSAFDPADVFARRPPERTRSAPSVPRVGVVAPETLVELGCTPAVVRAQADAVQQLEQLHARVHTVDLGPFLELGGLLYGGPWLAERTASVGGVLTSGADDLDPVVASIVEGGARFSAVDLHRAAYRRREILRVVEREFVTMDALLLPTVPRPVSLQEVVDAPVEANTLLGTFTSFANLADLCAIAIPIASPGGVQPGVGVSLLAPAWHERSIVSIAELILGEVRPASNFDDGLLRLAVAGAHLKGEPLDRQLIDLGAAWEETTRTAPTYRLWAMHDSEPAKPALVHDDSGASIEVDIWRLDPAALGRFLQLVPAPLALGTVQLIGGDRVTGFVAEPRAIEGAIEITELGGWRAYDGRAPSLA